MTLTFNSGIVDEIEDLIISRGNRTLDAMAASAIEFSPEKSGDLKSAIKVLKYFSRGSLTGEVGVTGIYYAPFVHFGTKHMMARPFLLRAFDANVHLFVTGDGIGANLSPTGYRFPPTNKQYTYLSPGETPPPELPSSGINFLPITPGATVLDPA